MIPKAALGLSEKCYFGLLVILLQTYSNGVMPRVLHGRKLCSDLSHIQQWGLLDDAKCSAHSSNKGCGRSTKAEVSYHSMGVTQGQESSSGSL